MHQTKSALSHALHAAASCHKPLDAMQVLQNRKYLAVADEEGYVSVLDTSAPLPRGLHDEGSTPAQWLAHHNAIFDLAWCKVGMVNTSQSIAQIVCNS